MPKTIANKEQQEISFNKKVNKESGVRLNNLQTDCWEWTGGFSGPGYGWFRDGYAHRWSYEHFKGEIEDGKCILHQCDNRKCVNPTHLTMGSKADNNKEALQRNPKASGRKLQETDLPKIVERMNAGELLKDIAKDFGMNWKCVSRRLETAGVRPEYNKGKKDIDEDAIRRLRDQGRTMRQIAEELSMSASKICNVLKEQ